MTTVETNVHFREHDIEFLQKRTKLWLQAVLGERFDDQRSLAELIADGNLLYRVAKYVIKDVTGKSPGPEAFSPKAFSEAAIQGKNSGKYLPYSNVDTFLKMCRTVGLSDVDLFTPPDAVEGKDMRRVCVAIRALARRARAQHIRVPDFDDVNRPLPMPKEKVGEIREHLQHASSTPPVTPTVPTPELDIQKSERVQIISNFLSSTKTPTSSPQLGTETSLPVITTSELRSADTANSVAPSTPGPAIRDNENMLSTPSTPAATIAGLSTPDLRKSRSALESSPIHPLDSSYNFVPAASPSPLPMFKPEWIPLQDLGIEEYTDSPEEASSQTQTKSPESSQPQLDVKDPKTEEGTTRSRELQPDMKTPPEDQQLRSQSSMKKSNSEAQLTNSQPERSESRFNEAPPKLPSPVKNSLVTRSVSKDTAAPKPGSKDTVARDSAKPGLVNGLRPLTKEPTGSSKPIQINLNLRVWGPVIAGAVAFLGTFLAVRSRDPVLYEVKRGDTLTKISKKTGRATWEELIKLNPNIKNPDLIYPSERLKLPV
ncbi:hypothetical protein MPTK1_3g21780 [Marchantia polymorpha subsp. ruderalis]|uniref:LysM domain-containing protein n=2 Tax=Marchantia polymorpha TaxID=3197 RepID=A0A176VRA9_MARPO|nr:hypothetical protein AXG93_4139s1040 [Marchantia polymorpha subsp. ruderalis]PTQ33408.1 hypothetical protein MARPO_0089s0038 [Marchantia polymorpha]BBN06511.1 hypothetical protein Mp_3g21780 [Marchantia polymorpha subsp. ruderalis]|eukprot:PTQ33408.1 hypothetical protein MARPO_0089s0038 [Marchantia polymorpha]